MTPLIDVIFLLLFFFMLSSTFSRFSEVRLASGTAAAGASAQPDAIVSISAADIRVNGASTPKDDLGPELQRLKASGAARILVIVSRDAISQDLVSVMEEISASALSVSVARQNP